MLPYCQQFCNVFPASPTHAWQRAWAAWRPLSPASLTSIQPSLQAVSRTPLRLPTPLLYVTRTHPPTPHAAARTWWTPRSISLLDDYASMPCHQPHVLALGAVYLYAPEGSAVII